jgi:hypothetical protein
MRNSKELYEERPESRKYDVEWVGAPEDVNPENDNVDVYVRFEDGETYVATFFTIANVESLLERYATTGECGAGCTSGLHNRL